MRIIAGALKGRRLAPVQGRIRPTAAKVREAVFNILGPAVGGVRVLDLFAGTGALGIEALSRGATEAVFVEDHPGALKVLRRNLEDLGLLERSVVWTLPVARGLEETGRPGRALRPGLPGPPVRRRCGGGGFEGPGLSSPPPARGPGGGGAQPPGDPAGGVRRSHAPRSAALWRYPGGRLSDA